MPFPQCWIANWGWQRSKPLNHKKFQLTLPKMQKRLPISPSSKGREAYLVHAVRLMSWKKALQNPKRKHCHLWSCYKTKRDYLVSKPDICTVSFYWVFGICVTGTGSNICIIHNHWGEQASISSLGYPGLLSWLYISFLALMHRELIYTISVPGPAADFCSAPLWAENLEVSIY